MEPRVTQKKIREGRFGKSMAVIQTFISTLVTESL